MANNEINKLRLAKNIYALRTAYGETQDELAHSLGLEGKQAVSNWENAEKIPGRDTIISIAKHYNVPAEMLINEDMSDFTLKNKMFSGDLMDIIPMVNKLVPLVCSEKALRNEDFRLTYEEDLRIHSLIESDEDDSAIDLTWKARMEKYAQLLDEGIPEAGINCLRHLFFIESQIINYEIIEKTSIEVFKKNQKDVYFKNMLTYGNESLSGPYNNNYEKVIDQIECYEDLTYDIITKMKQYPEWRDYLEYYVAMKHILGASQNGFSKVQNNLIGVGMMTALALSDNEYAWTYLELIFPEDE